MWPRAASITVSPCARTRASLSVMMSNFFICYDAALMADMRPNEILLSADQIQKRVAELAAAFRRDFPDDVQPRRGAEGRVGVPL